MNVKRKSSLLRDAELLGFIAILIEMVYDDVDSEKKVCCTRMHRNYLRSKYNN